MSVSKNNADIWNQIFDNLILDSEPPIKYIKDAVIITKTGARFTVSPDDFANIVAREKMLDSDQCSIHSCSLSIDFNKVKRDVNRWTNKFINDIETDSANLIISALEKSKSKSKTSTRVIKKT